MKEHLKALLIVSGLAVLIVTGVLVFQNQKASQNAATSEGQRKIQIHQRLPDFEAKDLLGKTVTLSQFKGKVVVVNFWASWCAPCIEEVPSLLGLLKSFPNDLVLLAVSGDSSQADIDSFMKSFPEMKTLPNSYVIWDAEKKLAQQFQVFRLPESFIANKDLKLVKKISGTIDWHTPDAIAYMKDLTSTSSQGAVSAPAMPIDVPQDEHTGEESSLPDQK